jgi:hypothetical protein
MQLVADHDDRPHLAAGVDDAVAAAQRLAGPADGVDGLRDLIAILGVLCESTSSVVGVTVPG